MLVPVSWLKEYVDIELPIEELAAKLSASGSAVERTYHVGGQLDDLIVAKAVEVAKHPNADRLKVAQVDTGSEVVEVVCGAPNLESGQHIVFARPGSKVPIDMHDPERKSFVLQEATIRGVVSHGMICSTAEMGLGEDHAGILVLPDSTILGQPVGQALGYPQVVLDIEVTTNRADELSMIGLAREVSVLTGKELRIPTNISDHPPVGGDAPLTVRVDTPACSRLIAQRLNVTVGPSPWWLQQYLSLYGMRSINNVVDITNFVMLELGQPLHAYDVHQLSEPVLIARKAQTDEKITTLDGIERALTPAMTIIADGQYPVGIAGIMGGASSMISEATTEIILEAAVFDAVSVRRTANALALRSEASKRFERHVDAAMTATAFDRAIQLLIDLAQAQILSHKQDVYPAPAKPASFTLTQRKLDQYAGKHYALVEAAKILDALGFKEASKGGRADHEVTALTFEVPSWRRRDIEGEEDLIEEVVRILGYDQLPIALPSGPLPSQLINQKFQASNQIKQTLAQSGWTEVITPSLTSMDIQQRAGLEAPTVGLVNPLSSEWTHLRQSLLPGLLDVAQRNSKNRSNLRLFELSSVYRAQEQDLPQQSTRLGLLLSSAVPLEASLAALKGVVESVLAQLIPVQGIKYHQAAEAPAPLEPVNALQIMDQGHSLGWMGTVTAASQAAFDVPEGTVVAELELENLLQRPQVKQFKPLPQYPAIEEDLSLIMEEDMGVGTPISLIRQAAGEVVEDIALISTYRHESLGQNQKSPLLHITYRAADRTLSSAEMTDSRAKIFESLKAKNIQVRTQ